MSSFLLPIGVCLYLSLTLQLRFPLSFWVCACLPLTLAWSLSKHPKKACLWYSDVLVIQFIAAAAAAAIDAVLLLLFVCLSVFIRKHPLLHLSFEISIFIYLFFHFNFNFHSIKQKAWSKVISICKHISSHFTNAITLNQLFVCEWYGIVRNKHACQIYICLTICYHCTTHHTSYTFNYVFCHSLQVFFFSKESLYCVHSKFLHFGSTHTAWLDQYITFLWSSSILIHYFNLFFVVADVMKLV